MTNTKFRKRALLSSVAMLLVAMLALGSATFAWFAVDPSVSTADSLKMTTKASTGIKILSETERVIWAEAAASGTNTAITSTAQGYAKSGVMLNAQYKAEKDKDMLTLTNRATIIESNVSGITLTTPLIPQIGDVDLSTGSTWKTAAGTDSDSGGVNTEGYKNAALSYDPESPSTANCYMEKIYFMRTDSTIAESIAKATVSWSDEISSANGIDTAVRVAMLSSSGALLAVWGDAANTISGYTISTSTAGTLTGTHLAANGSEATLSAAQAVSASADTSYVWIVVYIDGEAAYATSDAANNAGTAAILKTLSVELTVG